MTQPIGGEPPISHRESDGQDYEIELIPGLEAFVENELRSIAGSAVLLGRPREGRISVQFSGDPACLCALRSAVAVHAVETFEVARPRGLLGHAHFTRLVARAKAVTEARSPEAFQTIRLSAAGGESAVFARFRSELGEALGLKSIEQGEDADLVVSVRRAPAPVEGWQVLTRLTPRPLSARKWRICNQPGALNATVANVMVRIAEPSPIERFLNLACGSGTLLVERLELGAAALAIGCDISAQALACAEANLQESGCRHQARLLRADAGQLPLGTGAWDTIVADLPYGMLDAPSEARSVYGGLVAEAARVAAPSARFVAITARKQWLEAALQQCSKCWETLRVVPIRMPYRSSYFSAYIFALRRL